MRLKHLLGSILLILSVGLSQQATADLRASTQTAALSSFVQPWPQDEYTGWRWHQGTAQDITANFFNQQEQETITLPPSHPVHLRLQYWLDRLHYQLQQKFPLRMALIPKPQVRIYHSTEINGFAAYGAVQHPVGITITQPAHESFADDHLHELGMIHEKIDELGNTVHGLASLPFSTVPLSLAPQSRHLIEFLNHLNRLPTKCRIQLKAKSLKATPECYLYISRSTKFGYNVSLNILSLSTALLQQAENEAQVLFVLLHEAAHYYGAHNTLGREQDIEFFYDIRKNLHKIKPTSDLLSTTLGRNALKAAWNSSQPDTVTAPESFLRKQGIALYNQEQESDLMALQFALLMGIDPKGMGDFNLNLLKKSGHHNNPSNETTFEQCVELRKNSWLQNGQLKIPEVGSLLDKHKYNCFRVFETDRLVKLLRPPHFKAPEKTLSTSQWQSFLKGRK